MSEQQSSGGFAKAFVPGLVLGLVIGAFAGATLPSLLSEQKLPEHTGGPIPAAAPSDRDSEVMPGGDETASPDELTEEIDEGTTPPDETDDQTPPDQDEADDGGAEEDDGQDG